MKCEPYVPPVELTEEDRKNGWSPEAAAEYHAGRAIAQAHYILHRPRPRPTMANSKYSPLNHWRTR